MTSKPLLILQMGKAPEAIRSTLGEQPAWFGAALGDAAQGVQVVRPFLGEDIPDASDFSATVITGSWAMVTDRADWSERSAAWIRQAMAIDHPLLGVCYGHQLMAYALGGEVDYHPNGPEVGLHTVTLSEVAAHDPLFGDFAKAFDAYLSHEQSVLRPPPGATVLGGSAHDAHQILRYGPKAVSVQFHPEFTPALMRACMTPHLAQSEDEARDVAPMLAPLAPTPVAQSVLLKFLSACAA